MILGGFAPEEEIAERRQFHLFKEGEWGSDEFYDENDTDSLGKPPEEPSDYLFDDDEKELVSSNGPQKNNCISQGVTGGDIMEFEKQVKDLMESVRNFQTRLSEDGRIGDVFKVDTAGERGNGERLNAEGDVRASMEEIEKMDAVLRVKAAEERQAKLCRIQAEEESRDILSKLPCSGASNIIRGNLEEFMRLLNDLGETECDPLALQRVSQVDEAGDKEKNKESGLGEKKAEKKSGEERKVKHLKFIEKNIQLAKCGRGILSLTEDEKQRIEELMTEAEDNGARALSEDVTRATKEIYAIDDETKSVLTKIDQRLEAVAKAHGAERCGSKLGLLEKQTREEEACERGGKNSSPEKGKAGEKKKESRLAEINRLLNAVNSVTQEEITPLSEEDIESLLEQSKRSLGEESFGKEQEEGRNGSPAEGSYGKESLDVISELVANAKLLMPKFKYRFNSS